MVKPSEAFSVYLASPWFNPDQMSRMLAVHQILTEWVTRSPLESTNKRTLFAPYYDNLCPPDASIETRRAAYAANVQEAAESDILVAVTDEKDIGTIFELGYAARARDIIGSPTLVGVALTLGDKPFNLMLSEGLDVVCKSLIELRDFMLHDVITYHSNDIE